MQEENNSDKKNKAKYFAIVLGQGEEHGRVSRDVLEFEYKRELSRWLIEKGAQVHSEDVLREEGYLQLPDGRDVLIIHGHKKGVQTRVSVM